MAGKKLRKHVNRSKPATLAQPKPPGEIVQEDIGPRGITRTIARMNRVGRASTPRKATRPATARKAARTKGTTRRRAGTKRRAHARA